VILEGIVTTLGPGDVLNIAPMGPEVEADRPLARFILRPYRASTTYRNLKLRGEGVFHVSDDVLLLAQSAIGVELDPKPITEAARKVAGMILIGSCRYYEFRVKSIEDQSERTTMVAETVAEGRLRDFFGFNRAKHAVLEAAILATRLAWLPYDEIASEFRKLEPLVRKTGGPSEQAAFRLLERYVGDSRKRGGVGLESGLVPS
jgi:hypothetical protein